MKNTLQLKSFTSYCEQHPEERFWQALRNWAEVDFVLVANQNPEPIMDLPWINIRDTFYDELTRAERMELESLTPTQ